MEEPKISLTLRQLENLLFQQKQLTAENLLNMTYYYNSESTESISKSMQNMDREKFKEVADKSRFPNDLETLKRYL